LWGKKRVVNWFLPNRGWKYRDVFQYVHVVAEEGGIRGAFSGKRESEG
jgi:hypothetical protein